MAYVAIETKFLGPTNYRGARIKAFMRDKPYGDQKTSLTMGYDHALDGYENHERVAYEFMPNVVSERDGVRLEVGSTRTGYVFVPVRFRQPYKAS